MCVCACAVPASGLQDRAEARRVHLGGEEEGETFHGAAQRAEDLQDLHEDPAAVAQVGSSVVWITPPK